MATFCFILKRARKNGSSKKVRSSRVHKKAAKHKGHDRESGTFGIKRG